jgi:hypothetical protein
VRVDPQRDVGLSVAEALADRDASCRLQCSNAERPRENHFGLRKCIAVALCENGRFPPKAVTCYAILDTEGRTSRTNSFFKALRSVLGAHAGRRKALGKQAKA